MLLQSICLLGSTSGASLPLGQGLNCPEEHAQPRPQAPRKPPLLPAFGQQVLARGSGKGAEGRVQGWLRNGDRKGPPGGGVDTSAASPRAQAAGSAVAAAAAATATPTSVPSVIRAPTVCLAGCWDPAGEEVRAFVGLRF